MARRSDSRWLVRSSAIALSFGCIAIGAMDRGSAQSFNGTPNVVAGQVDQFLTGSGTTDILINGATPQVVIDWTPSDTTAGPGAIAFQNVGTTTTFSRIGGSDFAVLNRILPAGAASGRSVLLDGSIQGRVSTGTPGGRIYFYTPNGLIIGPNAQIDVGALGLTTSNIQYTTGFGGGFITGTGSDTVVFTGANPGSFVTVQPAAQINATQLNLNNYVAILAPYIQQGGTINVNGSTALIAAEAGTMTWSNGLFDVQVSTGTDGDATHQAIFHLGSTGGPASGGAGDLHRIYTVAVPKNTAITTLIASGSSLGFDIAGAADVAGNAVILTGGYDIVGGSIVPSSGAGGGTSNVQVTNSAVTSDLSLHATGFGAVEAVGGGLSTLASNLLIRSPIAARLEASSASSSINIVGDVFLDASRSASTGAITGGNAFLIASGSAALGIGGSASLVANASTGGGATATGGLARVLSDSGASLTVVSDLSLASLGSINATETGDAVGGTAEFLVVGPTSAATISGDIDIDTAGLGGGVNADLSTGLAGGNGTGGTSRILVDVGSNSLLVGGSVNVEANGRGGDGNLAASGNGLGGTASIVARGAGSINILSDVLIEASATSGSVAYGSGNVIANATSGGEATAGSATLSVVGASSSISIGADLSIDATGTSDGTALVGPGGLGKGNIANIGVQDGTLSVAGATTVDASGFGGSGNANNDGEGGTINVVATGSGAMTLHQTTLMAHGTGGAELGASFTGGGTGGFARMLADDLSDIDVTGSLQISANGSGGTPDFNPGLLNPGGGIGGQAELSAIASASITVTNGVSIEAAGFGATAEVVSALETATGGAGSGGQARLLQRDAATIQIDQGLDVRAHAVGGIGSGAFAGVANGGAASAGTALINVQGIGTGSVIVNGTVDVDADATGGGSISNGSGGSAVGGNARVETVLGASATIQAGGADTGFVVHADGDGGDGIGSGAGGQGRGGMAQLIANSGDVTVTSVIAVSASGTGGDAVSGSAGAGYGGTAQVIADSAALMTLTINNPADQLNIAASGSGGNAFGPGNGGSGFGGQAGITTFGNGGVAVNGPLRIIAISDGGDGVNGGSGDGLLNPFLSVPASAQIVASTGTISVSAGTIISAEGLGGDAFDPGGNGGSGFGGAISVFSDGLGGGASITLTALSASASAFGGPGSSGGAGAAGGAGGSATAGAIGIGSSANNGDLVTANVTASVSAVGGIGGHGGDNPSGAGGNGGMGGNALGGAVIMGVFDSTTNGAPGSATFTNVTIDANATAGTGGNGGTGQTVNGNGGTGGSARTAAIGTAPSAFLIDGPSQILARGGSVVMGQYNLVGQALSGAGGSGNVIGQGGNAIAGGFDVGVRAGGASGLAGSLVVGNAATLMTTTASGAGGAEFFGSGPRISVDGGTATFLNLTIVQEGDQPIALPVPQIGELSVVNGALIVDVLSILTSGPMSVFLNNGSVFSDTIILDAGAFVANPGGLVPVNPGVLNGADSVTISSANGIFLDASISSDSDILLSALGSIRTFDLLTDGEVTVGSSGSIAVRNVNAAFDVDLFAAADLSFATVTSGGDANLSATGNITGTSVDAGDSVTVESGGNIVLGGEVTAGYFNQSSATGAEYSIGLLASGNINYGNIAALNQVGIGSLNGSVGGGQITAGSDVLILAHTGVTLGGIDTTGGPNSFVYIADSSMFALSPSIDPFNPAPILAAAPVAMAGPLTVGEVLGGNFIFAADGNAVIADVDVGGIVLGRAGQITGGDIRAAGRVRLESTGLIGALSLTSTLSDVELLSGATVFAQRIAAQGSVAVQAANDIVLFGEQIDTSVFPGEISAGGSVRLVAQSGSIFDDTSGFNPSGSPTSGNPIARISAGNEILLLAGNSVNLGTLGSSTGAVYVANSSMAALGGTFDNFQIGNLLEVAPAAVSGSILLRQVSGSSFVAASEGPFTIGSVTANQFVFMRSQTGLLSIGGTVQGRDVIAASADIDIGVGGGITALSGGVVTLGSLNSTGAVIGDGATGGGYRLSAAELSRISGDSVEIFGLDVAGLPIDMVIGNLSVTGPLAGSTIEATSGELSFTTGVPGTQTAGGGPIPSGGIRITGSLAARGFTPTNQLGFFTGTLQLDANTGLIEILGQGTQLAGEIVLGAERFHAADATILDRLLENPLYADRIDNINTPLAVSRPDGILRSEGIETETLSQFLIQNTGTRDLPAGVVVVSDGPIEFDFGPSPGSLEYVVNGQTITDSGTLTGTQVFDFLINDDNRDFFAPGSSVNGCLISDTACSIEPNVTEMDTEFLPADSLTHFTEEPARDEQVIDPEERDEAEEESKRAPIPPPTPIISTQPLAPVIDVDEPVAGAGNPGLISSALVPAGQGRETAQ